MITIDKVQRLVFDTMIKGDRIWQIPLVGNKIAFTNGFAIFVIPKKRCLFNLDMIPTLEYKIEGKDEGLPQIRDTGICSIKDGRTLSKYQSEDGSVVSYADKKWISFFAGANLYSKGGADPIYARDAIGNLLGMLLPVRVSKPF